ncbi:hypothetical protein [Mesorhizobium sp. IMUNJ 23232]|uniref:hypothetical protein n=1 Tax=Mesorhizobium sp. IMUNJ 23232 TaxID=3376064 RepID=UPI0037A51577
MTDVDQRPSAVVPFHDASGRFARGNPGRVPGSRNKVSNAALTEIRGMKDSAIAILRQKLAAGDWDAVIFVLDRVLPKGRPIDVPDASAATVSEMLAAGELTITEAKDLATAIERLAGIASIDELRSRLEALEASINDHRRA